MRHPQWQSGDDFNENMDSESDIGSFKDDPIHPLDSHYMHINLLAQIHLITLLNLISFFKMNIIERVFLITLR